MTLPKDLSSAIKFCLNDAGNTTRAFSLLLEFKSNSATPIDVLVLPTPSP